ncbi:MAG TPA: hypothetical protein VG371_17440 [Solirubrobacteraceae bacterium]|jgi:hypothetical protein|nr:hypothetical protein [Solirubrobacteraceae bacterium]
MTGVRSGLLLAVIGLWLVMRTTHQDASGRTLIDHIIGKTGLSTGQVAAGVQPGQAAVTPNQALTSAGLAVQPAGGVNLQAPTLDPTVVAGGFPTLAPATGPSQGINVAPAATAQIQGAINRLTAAGNQIR